jgi:S-adenosylmethionine hydrolase
MPAEVPAPRIVTLTTDFGAGSGYVAEMKGRILHARVPVVLVDIAHDVPAHDVRAAAWLVGQACPAFPQGTLHIIVVDPGVGTRRRLLWVRAGGHEYLAPDNVSPESGVLTRVLAATPAEAVRELTVPAGASTTFHGRDVLAPAAVALLDGVSPDTLGAAVTDLVTIAPPLPRQTAAGLAGEIVHVDTFGNLLTNLPADQWPRLVAAGRLCVGGREVGRLVRTYGDAAPGTVVALVGSQGVIEVAVVQGRADVTLAAGVGTEVLVP